MVGLAVTLAAAYAGACALLFLGRNRIIFPIRGGLAGDPARFGFPAGRTVVIETDDGARLAGWLVPPDLPGPPGAPMPLLVWFPGNAETIAGIAPIIHGLKPPGVAVLAMDHRGYGASTGWAGVRSAEQDALAIWRWIAAQPDIDASRVVAYGRSVGSGPALALAAQRPVAGLILESAFTSLRALARAHYRLIPSGLAGRGFDNLSRIAAVACPVLVIHGDRDEVIPVAMGRELAARAAQRGELFIVPGAYHNDVYDAGGAEYRARVHRFLERITRAPL